MPYTSEERVALERIYRFRSRDLDVDCVRWLAAGLGYPVLWEYAQALSKVVKCHDVFRYAWRTVGKSLREAKDRRGTWDDAETVGLAMDLLPVVDKLAKDDN